MIIIKCQQCGKKFQGYISQHRKFCSLKCATIYPVSREIREKMKRAKLGKKNPEHSKFMTGRKLSEETKKKISESNKGEKSHRWKDGIKKRYKHTCATMEYRKWRMSIFLRDNFTCQFCRARSKAGEPIYLEAHHIKSWVKYPELRYKVENGITLCRECHKLIHTKP